MSDGKQETSAAVLRQWALLRKIPRYPVKKTAAQFTEALAGEGMAVTKRTVERDLLALAEAFPTIECDDREKPFGWSWARNAPMLHLPGMTASEALAFQMIERLVKPLLPASVVDSLDAYFRASSEKLSELSGKAPAASWAKKVRVVHPTQLLIPPKVNSAVHRAVTEGLLLEKQMEIVYRRRSKAATVTHIVNPLGLVQRGPVTYFVVNQSKDPFYLAMHRISKASLLEQRAERPAGREFDLDDYIAKGNLGFGRGNRIRLEALFSPEIAAHLRETPLAEDQVMEELPDKRVRVTATVAETPQLKWWLLGFGKDAIVTRTDSLRSELASTASAMAANYSALKQ